MAEATGTPSGPGKSVDFYELCFFDPCQHQLRNAVTALNAEQGIAEIEQDHTDLSTIIRVDGPGCVQHTDSVLERQAAARPHLAFISFRDGHSNASGNKFPAPRFDRDRPFHCRIEVNAGGMLGLIVRDGQSFRIFELGYMNGKMFRHSVIQESEARKAIAVLLSPVSCLLHLHLQHRIRHIGLAERTKDRKRQVLARKKLLRQLLHLVKSDCFNAPDDIIH